MSTDAQQMDLVLDGERLLEIAQPESIQELRELVSGAAGSLLVLGGGTRLTFGNVGGPFDRAISTRRLNRVIQYEPDDLTIAVEPGITVAELTQVLGERGQMLPIDSPQPENSTLGGVFASGIGGPRRLRYGSMRDWVLGVEVMDGTGIVTKAGGMVVKNVTGYDVTRLHHAAHGAFGIVTRLNMKVLPRPAASRSIVVTFETAGQAHAAALAVLSSQFEPVSVLVSLGEAWTLSVRCDGLSGSIDAQSEAIVEAATADTRPTSVDVTEDGAVAIEPFLETVDLTAERATARLAIPASTQLDALEVLGQLSGSQVCADPGSGLIYVAGLPSLEWRDALRSVYPRAAFLSLPSELKRDIDVFGGMDEPASRYVTDLKNEYDPDRRFNRGRFVLGL